jgi:hypothetical protein
MVHPEVSGQLGGLDFLKPGDCLRDPPGLQCGQRTMMPELCREGPILVTDRESLIQHRDGIR